MHLYAVTDAMERPVMLSTRRPRQRVQRAYLDALLDQALEDTFPASDPVAIAIDPESLALERAPKAAPRAARTGARDSSTGA